MYTCICPYTYTHIYIHIYMCIYIIFTYIHHIFIHTHIYMCVFVFVCIYIYQEGVPIFYPVPVKHFIETCFFYSTECTVVLGWCDNKSVKFGTYLSWRHSKVVRRTGSPKNWESWERCLDYSCSVRKDKYYWLSLYTDEPSSPNYVYWSRCYNVCIFTTSITLDFVVHSKTSFVQMVDHGD